MDIKKVNKDEIIDIAKKAKRYCDLFIEQSDSWLSEEEELRNLEKRYARNRGIAGHIILLIWRF